MKTAVDFLLEQIRNNKFIGASEQIEVIYAAKQIENAQRQKDFKAGNDSACMDHENIEDYFKQYIKSK